MRKLQKNEKPLEKRVEDEKEIEFFVRFRYVLGAAPRLDVQRSFWTRSCVRFEGNRRGVVYILLLLYVVF